MIHIVITAGGTEEPIDGVRKITNMSSGSLGWHCLEAMLEYMYNQNRTDFEIHYIKAPKAVTKQLNAKYQPHVNFVNISDTQSVYNSVERLMDRVKIDLFIHSMAISDFAYAYSASIENLANELHQAFRENKDISTEEIETILRDPKSKYSKEDKISSQKEIVMGFKTTPKVISLIKKKSPETFLIGFKLVKSHDEEFLISEAEKLRKTNRCDAVFANESSQLSEESHAGILMHLGKIVARPKGKREIAETIVNFAVNEILKDK